MTGDAPFDVVVAGAGLPGLALAAAAARSGLSVAIADAAPIAGDVTVMSAGASRIGEDASAAAIGDTGTGSSDAVTMQTDDRTLAADSGGMEAFDIRVYAVSPGSATFLRGIGAWQRLDPERLAAIEAMDVQGDRGGRLEFSAYDLGERALAWIVEERALRKALLAVALEAGVEPFGAVPFVGLQFTTGTAALALRGRTLEGRLLVAADGVHSWVRHAAGIAAEPKPYGQRGVVAHFSCERAHHGIARQWFRDDASVLAWLPLPGRRISMVWSAPDAMAAELMNLAPPALAARVAAAGGRILGELTSISPAAGFPLASLRLATTVAHRLALVGDAAHGVHPLAGQGVNLGFGDALVLADVLASRGPVADAGAPMLLARYARRRTEPVLAMHAVTDGLVRLFGPRQPWLAAVRNAGMAAVDRLPLLKRALAQPALR